MSSTYRLNYMSRIKVTKSLTEDRISYLELTGVRSGNFAVEWLEHLLLCCVVLGQTPT